MAAVVDESTAPYGSAGPGTRVEHVTSEDWAFGVHRQGAGDPVVLLHGLLTDSRVWYPVMTGLASEGRLALAVDAPGHGHSPARTTAYTLEEEVDRLADACRTALGGDAPAVWVGHSMGGMKALRMALRHPDLVRALVLVDTQPYREPENTARPFEAMVESVLTDGMSPDLARMIARLNFHRSFQGSDRAEFWIRHFETLTGDRITHACHSVYRRGDISDRLGSVRVPVLVVHGAGDVPIRPRVAHRYAAQLPYARIVELPDTGHTPPVERSAELLALTSEFVRSLTRPPMATAQEEQ
ncbi:alpha/beta hydrolase [Streptomyces sp. NPDC051921]|uniref:alpha/beta fold hydrolase n=1 Tax=Streptomyces sp. NPDC051921 TaxID=3155806 RepID=UPI0034177656